MQFKEWFVVNEIRIPPGFNPRKELLRKHTSFSVDPDGNLRVGYDQESPYSPYIEIVRIGREKAIRAHNLQPSSRLFKSIVNALRPYLPDIEDYDVAPTNLSHPDTGNTQKKGRYYRKVAYWLNQSDTDFSHAKIPQILYHGTSTELWYEGIKSQGLIPRSANKIAGTGSYGAQNLDALSRNNVIYLSVHPDSATRNAARQAANTHGGQPMILKVRTDGLFPEKFTYDEDMDRRSEYMLKKAKDKGESEPNLAQVSQLAMGTVGYVGKIPVGNVEPYLLGVRDSESGLTKDWVKFQDVPRDEHPVTKKVNKGDKFGLSGNPLIFALMDAGVVTGWEQENNSDKWQVNKVDDHTIRQIIRNSSKWVREAEAINRDLSDWNNKLAVLNEYPDKWENPEHQKVADLLVQSDIYGLNDTRHHIYYTKPFYRYKKAINLAKLLVAGGMNFNQLVTKMAEMAKSSSQVIWWNK